ncbi:MAG: hypothetical protein P4K80_10375 [Acidobacteriaceae bacterium]|nr:hypothetical protein [Acidobacteriaceae bacterium]
MNTLQRTSQFVSSVATPAAARSVAIRFSALLLLSLGAIHADAQAVPAAAPPSLGFALPTMAGSLQYAISVSEILSSNNFGNSSGVQAGTSLSGDLAFITNSKNDPFSMIFNTGRTWSSSNQPSYSYMNLAMSQVVNAGRWNFVLSDSVSYMPGTASTGLSGVPGVGDLGVTPVQVGADTGQGVLTGYSNRLSNTASLSVQRQLTGKTALQGSGSYAASYFLSDVIGSATGSNAGLDNGSETGSLGLMHRIDARNSVSGTYSYANYTYSGNNFGIKEPGFVSQTVSAQYSHQFTRKLGMSLSAGPQWISINSSVDSHSLNAFVDSSVNYAGQYARTSLAYVRSTNGGYGVVGGSTSDSVSFSTSRTFDRAWLFAGTVAYSHTSNLPMAGSLPFTFHTTVVGGQVSRAVVHNLSAYVSYTIGNQSNQGTAPAVDFFSGLTQSAGFGLTYSPGSIHLGRQ